VEKLELVAALQKVSDLHAFLPSFLDGTAISVYRELSGEEKGEYTKLKAALLRGLNLLFQ